MIKKVLFSMLLCLLSVLSGEAGRMPNYKHTVKLMDGRTVTFTLRGDTRFSYRMTTTGEYILQDGNNFRAATAAECAQLRHSLDSLNAVVEEENRVAEANSVAAKSAFASAAASGKSTDPSVVINNGSFVPHSGNVKILVILVSFTDAKILSSHTVKYFNDSVFNGNTYHTSEQYKAGYFNNYSSVRQYFTDVSSGQLTPVFTILDPITLEKKKVDYIFNHSDFYWNLFKDACDAVDAEVDFSQYELISLMVAGECYQNTAKETDVAGRTVNTTFTRDGKTFHQYFVGADQGYFEATSIGIICHEFCHAMGMPDVYPNASWLKKVTNRKEEEVTVYSSDYNNQSMEYWDLMDAGEHTYAGYIPTPLSYMERWMFGWVSEPETVADDSFNTLAPICTKDGMGSAKRIVNPNNPDEYWILENIPRIWTLEGRSMGPEGWYEYIPKWGMLVTHIDYSSSYFVSPQYPNNIKGKPKWTILPADGVLYSTYLSLNDSLLIGTSNESLYMDADTIFTDMTTDTYPLSTTKYIDKTSRPYTYITKNVNSISNWKAYTASDGLKEMKEIKSDGNGKDVTFIYGDYTPSGVKEVEGTEREDRKPIKIIRNGKVIIFKDGREYNVAGAVLGS